jgi:hypothetical protein
MYSFEYILTPIQPQSEPKEQAMSTMTPTELFNLWKQDQLTVEMSIGHILQNLVKQQTVLESLLATQGKPRTDVNNLSAATEIKPDATSKPKPLKPV